MTKTIQACLLLLGVLALHRVEAQIRTEPSQAPPTGDTQPAGDPLGRSTPQGAADGLIRAAEQNNLERAAEYLDSRLPLPERTELARKLWVVLDRRLAGGATRLSTEPEGDLRDGLTSRDRIGTVEGGGGNVDLFLDRVQRGQGDPIWLVSAVTLREIPALFDEIQPPWIERHVPSPLRIQLWSIALYRWIAVLLLIPVVFGIAALATRALTPAVAALLRRFRPEKPNRPAVSVGPLRLLVLSVLFYAVSFWGISLASRNFWQRVAGTLMIVALCWIALRLLDVVAELSLHRLERRRRSADTALVLLINRLMKAAAVVMAVLFFLYSANVDLTAALTGLGVGGIAIGFGAQKTIENLFGGIMVISDKPVNVGDVCKAGEFMGTVEDIGIRSTRIRTVNRTVVSVPNGLLSAMSLENFSQRDQILFQHTVSLVRQTSADQMRLVLEQIRGLLDPPPRVDPTTARTRFIRVGTGSLDLEVFAYVLEREMPQFLAVQEELLLGIMDILEAAGTADPVPLDAVESSQLAKR
jgi:MscS family membrane protein